MSARAPLWTSEEAIAAAGGRCTRPWAAGGIGIDSRTIATGDLFVALKGPSFDGHDFVAEALAKGAAAALVHRIADEVPPQAPLLFVDDTLVALNALGRFARARARAGIVGVTGSVGKTGVKEALKLVLGRQGKTTASAGSLNNHWGLPLSLARLPADADYGVFEMGMNHAGELTPLVRLARPHVAVITAVEAVHIENFSSVEAIADAKAEIFLGVEPNGAVVLPRDNPHYPRLLAAAWRSDLYRVLSFGSSEEAEVRLLAAALDADGASLSARVLGREIAYRVGLPGQHWVMNSLCVLAAVAAIGGDVEQAAAAVADLEPAKGRGQRFAVPISGGAFQLIDDSYNASPVSMAASFAVLSRLRPGAGGRRIAVLGDMLELGEDEFALHADLARPIAESGIDLVFAAGPRMRALYSALPPARRGAYAADAKAIAPIVAERLRPGDVVTVKGSAGSRMGQVVELLKSLGGQPAAPAAACDPAAGD